MFIGEAVEVFAVGVGVEGVVAGGDGTLVDDVVTFGVLDLLEKKRYQWMCLMMCSGRRMFARATELTQKSTSRLPAPPNSRSPT